MSPLERLLRWRWPTGEVTCPACGTAGPYWVSTRGKFSCSNQVCRAHFSPTSGTAFANNKLGVERLVHAVDTINAMPEDTTAAITRKLGLSYKGADYLVKRVRAETIQFPA